MRMIAWMLNLYPRRWRERYQEEMLAVLEQHTISAFTVFDLLRGALDARLDPAYRTQEGFMFHQFRDHRILSAVYICALAIFLFSLNFWVTLHRSIFTFNPPGATDLVVGYGELAIVSLCSFALSNAAGFILKNAIRHHQGGILLFALLCLGLIAEMIFWQMQTFSSMHAVSPLLWLSVGIQSLSVGMGVFVAGVKGLKLSLTHQRKPLALALVIVLLPSAGTILDEFWRSRGAYVTPSQIGLLIMSALLPYIPLSALLLGQFGHELTTRYWRMTRRLGVLLTFILVVTLAMIVIWNGSAWETNVTNPPVFNGPMIIDPTHGAWTLFGEQWIVPLITITVMLAAALSFALLVLVRSFLIRPENMQPEERLAMIR